MAKSVRATLCLMSLLAAVQFSPRSAGADPVPGNQYNLPVGALTAESALIGHAVYSMPAVQVAIDTCLARGYTREPSLDRAGQLINTNGPSGSYVILSFTRPNTHQAVDTVTAPMIGIISQNEFPNATVITTVDCSVVTVIRDASTDLVYGYPAENAPGAPYAATDPSFAIASDATESTFYWETDGDIEAAPKWFKQALGCFMVGNVAIGAGALQAGAFCATPITGTACAMGYAILEVGLAIGCTYLATQ